MKIISKEKGFSLLEVVISIAIIASLLFVYYAMQNNLVLTQTVKHKDIALKIASHEIEGLRALGYASLPSSGSFSDTNLSLLPSGAGAVAVSTYNSQTKQVVVTVSWTEPSGSKSIVLSTLITQSGGL